MGSWINIALVTVAVLLGARVARRRRVVRDRGGLYNARTGYYIQGRYTPRTFPGASDPIVMPNGGWNPDRPLLCLACADQLQLHIVEFYCCMGCSQWASRHVTNRDCSSDDGVRIRVRHYDEVKAAISSDRYAGYDSSTGVKLRPAGRRPTVEEQFTLVQEFVAGYNEHPGPRLELQSGPVDTDFAGFPCWTYRSTSPDSSLTYHFGFHPLYWKARACTPATP